MNEGVNEKKNTFVNKLKSQLTFRLGFELLHEKASTFDNHIRYISQYIMKKAGVKESTSVRHKTQVGSSSDVFWTYYNWFEL